MKAKFLILFIILLPSFSLYAQTNSRNTPHDNEWENQFHNEFENLMTGSNISGRTRLFLAGNYDPELLSGSPGEAAAFLFDQTMEMDRQFRRGVPRSKIKIQFRNSLKAYNRGRNSDSFISRGNSPFDVPPGQERSSGRPAQTGKPENPGKSSEEHGNSGQGNNP